MYDIVIRNGQIADGSGAAAFYGDVAVRDGKIVKIAPEITESAKEVIDAEGLQVTPGFIDNHSHSDSIVFTGSDCCNYLEQGVTTQVAGHCGDSYAPSSPYLSFPFPGNVDEKELKRRSEISRTPAGFMDEAAKQAYGTNIAFFIGHGPLRAKAMGFTDAGPTEEEMKTMKEELKQAMEAGFLGFSTGLVYAPSVYADVSELTELATVLPAYGGIYASHIRSEGDHLADAVKEAIAIGENSGCEVLISHLKVIGKHNEGKSKEVLELIDRAAERGVTVWADQYPYTAGSAPVKSQIPPKFMVGGMDAFLKRIADPAVRDEIRRSIYEETDMFESGFYTAGFDGSMISRAAATPQYVNKTIAQIAREEGKDPIDAVCDILLANQGSVQGIYFSQNPTDMVRIMSHPRVFCGSDWHDLPDERPSAEKVGGIHPRAVSTTVRRLELVRDFRLRTMEESVKNLSFDTARAMHLGRIGLIREGWNADLCVLEYDRLHAVGDYVHPYRKNEGIRWVIVNGQIAVKDGNCLKVRAGRLIRRTV